MAALDAEARAARRRYLERWILPPTARPMSDATISGSSPSARSSRRSSGATSSTKPSPARPHSTAPKSTSSWSTSSDAPGSSLPWLAGVGNGYRFSYIRKRPADLPIRAVHSCKRFRFKFSRMGNIHDLCVWFTPRCGALMFQLVCRLIPVKLRDRAGTFLIGVGCSVVRKRA